MGESGNMRAALFGLGLAIVTAAEAAPAGQNGIEGRWTAEQSATDGGAAKDFTLNFDRRGAALSGTMRSGADEITLFDVRESGTALSFTVVIPGTPYVSIHYSGARTGNEIRLVGSDESHAVYTLTANRIAPPAPAAAPAPTPVAPPVVAVTAPTPAPAPAPAVPTSRVAAPAARAPSPPVPPAPAAPAQGAPQMIIPQMLANALARAPAPPVAPAPAAAPPPRAPAQTATPRPELPQIASAQPTAGPAAAVSRPPAVPPGNLAGAWDVEETGPGQSGPATLVFSRNGRTLTGTLRAGGNETPLFEVRQSGETISFTRVIPGAPYVTINYSGTLKDDVLDLASGDGAYRLTAHRVSVPAATPPVLLPRCRRNLFLQQSRRHLPKSLRSHLLRNPANRAPLHRLRWPLHHPQ